MHSCLRQMTNSSGTEMEIAEFHNGGGILLQLPMNSAYDPHKLPSPSPVDGEPFPW